MSLEMKSREIMMMKNKFVYIPTFWERNSGKIIDLILILVAASVIGIMLFSCIQ
jgi:hypothetical protein